MKYSCLFHATAVEVVRADRAMVLKLSTGHFWTLGAMEAQAIRAKMELADGISIVDVLIDWKVPLRFRYKLVEREGKVYPEVRYYGSEE